MDFLTHRWHLTLHVFICMYMYKSMELYCKTDENPADIVTRISKHDLLKIIYGGKDLCVLKNASIENNISKSNSNTKLEKVIQEEITGLSRRNQNQ